MISHLFVHENIIKSGIDNDLYWIVEKHSCCRGRPADITIKDHLKNDIIHLHRPLITKGCLCHKYSNKLEVYCPPGILIGTVEATGPKSHKVFNIKDISNDTIMKIEGPLLSSEFSICTIYGHEIGKITREDTKFSCNNLMISYENMFDLTFPVDLEAKMKIVLLGASLLIVSILWNSEWNQSMFLVNLYVPTYLHVPNISLCPNISLVCKK